MGISGISSGSGFSVTKNGKTVQTANHNRKTDSEFKLKKKHTAALIAIWAFYSFLWIFPLIHSGDFAKNLLAEISLILLILLINFVPASIMMAILFYSSIFGKNTPEWHACKHKVAAMLGKKELQPTLENLKKMPRVSIFCGSFMVGLIGVLPLNMPMIRLLLPNLNDLIFLLLIFCFNLIIPLLLQYFFATAEPSEEKLKEALEVLKEFYK